MRKIAISIFIILALQGASSPVFAHAPAPLSKVFNNCTELNRTYPGGVSKARGITNRGGKTKKTPTVNAKVYAENKGKDRDKDGIACEK